MKQLLVYITRVVVALGSAILGTLLLLKGVMGAFSEDPAALIVGYVLAIAMLVNSKGTVELFLNKSYATLNAIACAAIPALDIENDPSGK